MRAVGHDIVEVEDSESLLSTQVRALQHVSRKHALLPVIWLKMICVHETLNESVDWSPAEVQNVL